MLAWSMRLSTPFTFGPQSEAVVYGGVAEEQQRRQREHGGGPLRGRALGEDDQYDARHEGDGDGACVDPTAPARLRLGEGLFRFDRGESRHGGVGVRRVIGGSGGHSSSLRGEVFSATHDASVHASRMRARYRLRVMNSSRSNEGTGPLYRLYASRLRRQIDLERGAEPRRDDDRWQQALGAAAGIRIAGSRPSRGREQDGRVPRLVRRHRGRHRHALPALERQRRQA